MRLCISAGVKCFPNAGFLRGSVLLGEAGPGLLSAQATLTLEKKVLCKQLCLPEEAVLAESHHSKGSLRVLTAETPTREDHLDHSP